MNRTRIRRKRVAPICRPLIRTARPHVWPMILATLGWSATLSQTRDLIDPGRDGASAIDLRNAARTYGIPAKALRLAPDLIAHPRAPLPTPFIAHWEHNHFIVVSSVHRRYVHLVDPAIGRRRLTRAEFTEHASGVVLLFDHDSELASAATPPPAASAAPVRSGRSWRHWSADIKPGWRPKTSGPDSRTTSASAPPPTTSASRSSPDPSCK